MGHMSPPPLADDNVQTVISSPLMKQPEESWVRGPRMAETSLQESHRPVTQSRGFCWTRRPSKAGPPSMRFSQGDTAVWRLHEQTGGRRTGVRSGKGQPVLRSRCMFALSGDSTVSPGTWLSTPAQSRVTHRGLCGVLPVLMAPGAPWERGSDHKGQGVMSSPASGMNLSKGASVEPSGPAHKAALPVREERRRGLWDEAGLSGQPPRLREAQAGESAAALGQAPPSSSAPGSGSPCLNCAFLDPGPQTLGPQIPL
uniref:Uncharacterized protein n=1 Tax=Molossus molossus TaxID=27622 RepID=A0A7J8ERH7_MOLMO|nr:hypothetical protein HJG59_008635 [Molossus molossus]